ncbi:MAG: ferredoxin [Desulfovibrionales bacterium]|nr:MAG: ferredoxin [Desulfovibrionales bacterium]
MAGKVVIDRDECIGCGNCEQVCPEVFRLDEEAGKAEVIKPEGGPVDEIQDAMDNCPMECISWEE